ncbi:CRAL/TRIO domain protein [Dictyocaulus viviparus]|uniref:CRAL/TRIO domain protein n=1 Tax=Dictyocaulus viviparus TaxID=29172 RepID=A0A0D8Y168_DICVI|nr:CRAL/TRIO domain protein [Dictyocaulus viviparus]
MANNSDLLSEKYASDYNILRWAQGYDFDLDEASAQLRRHLKFRRFYDLDNVHKIEEHDILMRYFPIGLVGETGKENTLLVIECAGRIDFLGILKSVQMSDFLIQRFRLQEKMLAEMNHLEEKTGKQAAVIYILDLEGLKFETSLLSIVTGPYRILWTSVYTNYPEWVSQMLIVNAPSFISLLWKGIAPFIPERTRNKVKICRANSDWKTTLQKYAKAENIPVYWGGKLVDSNGDEMCRDRLNIPFDPIPQELYWTPDKKSPGLNDLNCALIPAGKVKMITFVVSEPEVTYIVMNRFCDRTFGMGIWYSTDTTVIDLEDMDDWFPYFDYPGMPTVDYLRIKTPGDGVYKVKFSNEQSWIRSLNIFYRIHFEKENGDRADFKELQ